MGYQPAAPDSGEGAASLGRTLKLSASSYLSAISGAS